MFSLSSGSQSISACYMLDPWAYFVLESRQVSGDLVHIATEKIPRTFEADASEHGAHSWPLLVGFRQLGCRDSAASKSGAFNLCARVTCLYITIRRGHPKARASPARTRTYVA